MDQDEIRRGQVQVIRNLRFAQRSEAAEGVSGVLEEASGRNSPAAELEVTGFFQPGTPVNCDSSTCSIGMRFSAPILSRLRPPSPTLRVRRPFFSRACNLQMW